MVNYPASIDTEMELPTIVDNQTAVAADLINKLRDAIVSIETELGIKPSGIYSNVRSRIVALEIAVGNITGGGGGGGGGTTVFGGDLSGFSGNQSVIGLYGKGLKSNLGSVGSAQDGFALTWSNTDGLWEAKAIPTQFTAGTDLSGTPTNQTVIGMRGIPLNTISSFGTTPPIGGTWVYNEVGDHSFKPKHPTPPGQFDVKDYGAKGDGTTDDAPAINAAIQASASVAPYGATVLFSPGTYRLASPIRVTRSCLLLGVSLGRNGSAPPVLLKPDALVTAIIIDTPVTTPESGGDGAYAGVHKLSILGSVATIAVWQASHAYNVGDKVRRVNDNRYYHVCTVAGTSGSTEPVWNNALTTTPTTTDGSVTWTTQVHAGILARRPVHIADIYTQSFTNTGICVRGDTADGQSNVNGSTIERCHDNFSGVGFEVAGDDGNVVSINRCTSTLSGYLQSGTGGFAFVDASFLGVKWDTCLAEGASGEQYHSPSTEGIGVSVLTGCYGEGGSPPSYFNGLVLGGSLGSGFSTDSPHVGYDPFNEGLGVWRRIAVRDAIHPKVPHVWLDNRHGTYANFNAKTSNDDPGYYSILAERYESTGAISLWDTVTPNPAGWWITGQEGSWSRRITGYSVGHAAEGTGHYRVFRGEFRGDDNSPYYLGVAANSKVDPFIRVSQGVGGHLKPGDRFEGVGAGTSGSHIGQIVSTAGWTAPRSWFANFEYYPYTIRDTAAGDTEPSDAVHPVAANGYSYVCTKRGTTSSSEPTWPTIYLGSGGIVPYRWANISVKIGDYFSPSTSRNGHYYKVTAITSPDLNGFAISGASEPTWPTGSGATVTVNGITYTEQGSDVGTYVSDGTIEWQCVGPVPKLLNYGSPGDGFDGTPFNTAIATHPPTGGTWVYNDGYIDGYLTGSPEYRPQKPSSVGYYNVQDYGAIPDFKCGRKATIDNGSAVATLNYTTGLHVGQKMSIARVGDGYSKTILSISGNTVTFDSVADTSVVGNDIYTDNWDAFNAAIAAIKTDKGADFARGQRLIIDGWYYLSKTWVIDTIVFIEGTTDGPQYTPAQWSYKYIAPGTWLNWPKNMNGIRFRSGSDGEPEGVGTGAWGFKISNITLFCVDYDTTSGDGINASFLGTYEKVYVSSFGGHGFHLHAFTYPTAVGSCDTSHFYDCTSGANKGNGFHLEGNECNICSVAQCNAVVNGGYGFYDASGSGGNCYIGNHAEGNTTGQYWADGDGNQSSYFHCYHEGTLSKMGGQVTVIGGNLSQTSAMTADSNAFAQYNGNATRSPYIYTNTRGPNQTYGQLGGAVFDGGDMTVLQWSTDIAGQPGNTQDYSKLHYLGDATPWMSLNNTNADGREVIRFPCVNGNFRRTSPWAVNGLALGRLNTDNTTIVLDAASAQRTAVDNGYPVTYEVGDFTFDSKPVPGAPLGSRCKTAGTFASSYAPTSPTGAITSGTNQLTVSGTGLYLISVGCYIAIAGVSGTKKITAIAGMYNTNPVWTLDSNAGATVTAGAITFVAPTFELVGGDLSGNLNTTDGYTHLFRRNAIADGHVLSNRWVVQVRSTDNSATVLAEWDIKACHKRVSGTLSAAYTATITNNFTYGFGVVDPTITLNGNTDVDLNVTGITGSNLTWTVSEFSL
jgi:hypothetical protein